LDRRSASGTPCVPLRSRLPTCSRAGSPPGRSDIKSASGDASRSGGSVGSTSCRPDLGTCLVLELKYLTAAWTGDAAGEQFTLLSQGAQDIRAYDVVKDIHRVERFVDQRPGWSGAVLVLTNDPSYWQRPGHGRATNAEAFRIYEINRIVGERAWGVNTGLGTMKGRQPPIS
jgi:hypothetical protein